MSAEDRKKSREQLLEELAQLRRRVAELESRGDLVVEGEISQSALTEAIIRRAGEGICVCYNIPEYPYVRFTLWNDRMTEITGYTVEEINRLGWYQTMYPDPEVQKRAIERMASMREGDDILSEEWTITRKDGVQRVFSISTMVIFRRGGESHVAAFMRDITESKRAEEALRESEEKYRILFESAPEAIIILDLNGVIQDTNEYFHFPRSEVCGKRFVDLPFLHSQDRQRCQELFAKMLQGIYEGPFEIRLRIGGEERWIENHAAPLCRGGKPYAIQVISRDITDRKKLEQQLLQAQKMEAVGRLAGGVAHDFNNQLMVILNLTEMLLQTMSSDDPRFHQLELIKRAADQSAGLTRQLLAFSRRQVVDVRLVNINELLVRLEKMLARLIGEDIKLSLFLTAHPGLVRIDPVQFEQVIINLAVNARDAMPYHGKLTIETADILLDAEYTRTHPTVRPGSYVLIAVTDTGHGIPPEILPHIFEPFFTSKEHGKGTGLGLSTVYGIIKQAGGEIQVYSEPGAGTVFKIYLPAARAEGESRRQPELPLPSTLEGKETILVVEDNDAVRQTTIMILKGKGYHVLEADSAEKALALFRQHPGPVHLLITDVIMTGMSGKELADRLLSLQPELKVLYVSGYTDNVIAHHGILHPGTNFLPKPFPVELLLQKVRQLLNA